MALRNHATLDASEPLRRGNHSHVMSTPQAMASRFADHPEAVAETLAPGRAADVRPDQGSRLPLSRRRGATTPTRRLAELCAARLQERYGPARRRRAGAARGRARLEQELRVIDELGLAGFFLLHHEMLELAREVAVEVRGPDSVRALLAPGTRARLVGLLAGLLPHRALAHRPDRQRARAGALPARGPARAARHRPRLPARHPRGADPARARALRARPRGAGRGLSDLSRARRDPRAGQGARPARRARSSASPAAPSPTGPRRRARRRRSGVGRGGRRRRTPGARLARTAPPSARSLALALARRGWSSRPTGCRATSPSTPAG